MAEKNKVSSAKFIGYFFVLIVIAGAGVWIVRGPCAIPYFDKYYPACAAPEQPEAKQNNNNEEKAEVNEPLKKITRDLGIFVTTEEDRMNNFDPAPVYFDAGLFAGGGYEGYHKIVGLRTAMGPGGPTSAVFASKDYETFILDRNSLEKWLLDLFDEKSAAAGMDYAKVVKSETLPTNHPETISGGEFYDLVRTGLYIQPDKLNPNLPEEIFKKAESLKSGEAKLKLYTLPVDAGVLSSQDAAIQAAKKYIAADDTVLAMDAAGLVYEYLILNKIGEQRLASREYLSGSYPPAADLKATDLPAASELYKSYGMLLPGGCAMAPAYILKNVSEEDLKLVGQTAAGQNFYTFKDINHPLNVAEHYAKVVQFPEEYFAQVNNNMQKPDFAAYGAKNPVLLTRDPWNRWLAFGETEIQLIGGCGKPVLYFYPAEKTDVTVKFSGPVLLTADIPKYADGWRITAYPDGTFVDRQKEATDCAAVNDKIHGLEYAGSACAQNRYPYLYWAGFAFRDYPAPAGGFVVPSGQLPQFFAEKLTYMGLNEKETKDMMDYWVLEMRKKNAPYYRVAFIQNEEMSRFIPMQIEPRPDTLIRVFLDWAPLAAYPDELPQPQNLQRFDRRGFTVVEWGGLIYK